MAYLRFVFAEVNPYRVIFVQNKPDFTQYIIIVCTQVWRYFVRINFFPVISDKEKTCQRMSRASWRIS